MAEMKTKNCEKRALFSIRGRCVINCQQNRELEKHQGKKTTSIDEKKKVEVKLHAAVVLNITFWATYEPRRDT